MSWNINSLNRKFITGTAAGLVISSLVFLVLFITMYRNELESERAEAVSQVNNLLQTSLENAMLKRDLDGLRDIVNRLGLQPNINGVMIANPSGQVRFSSHPALIGKQLNPELLASSEPSTRFLMGEYGKEVLRSINPVHNKQPCMECHGSISKNPINGILFVDYDATSIRHHAQNTTLLLMGSGALIVLINLTGGWWFIRRYILKPVDLLSTASNTLSKGALDTRVTMHGSDELATLGATFNQMAENLQTKVLELEESRSFLQSMIDANPDGIRIIDTDFNILLTNRSYRRECGLPEESNVDSKCYSSIHGRDSPCPATLTTCPIYEINRNAVPLRVVHRHFRTDGSTMDVEIYAAPMHITRDGKSETLIIESIRDLAQDVQFSHEQRLSELGQLAAGVAHEIHNPLTSIRMALHASIKAAEQPDSDPSEILQYHHLVDHEIDKCIGVTERLLKLSSSPPSRPELVSIPVVIRETISLLKWEAQELNIDIKVNLGKEDTRVYATDSEMRMVVLNLAQNAFHAMPEGGVLTITATRKQETIQIFFEDNGIGITTDNLSRIFDPFFSRRADNVHGTGLGLSISKTIVENYGGTLRADSTLSIGSRFTVCLPDADSLEEG